MLRCCIGILLTILAGACEPADTSATRGVGGLGSHSSMLADDGRAALRDGRLDEAIEVLRRASEIDPTDAGVRLVLAKALVARADGADRPEDLLEAYAVVDDTPATDLRDELAGRLHLGVEPARTAGVDALLESLRSASGIERTIATHRGPLVEWVERRVLLPLARGETVAESARRDADLVASALSRHAGDAYVRDALATVDSTGSGPVLASLADWAAAVELKRADEAREAERRFRGSLERCEAACHPFDVDTRLHLAIYAYYDGDNDRARALLERVVDEAGELGYPSLLGRSHWMLGLIELRASRLEASLRHYTTAREALDAAHESGRVAEVDVRIAGIHLSAGRPLDAWRACHRGLGALPGSSPRRARQQGLFSCGRFARELGFREATAAYYDEALRLADAGGVAIERVQALLPRAKLLSSLGDSTAAMRDLRRARTLLPEVPDGTHRGQLEAELDALVGIVHRDRDPALARTHLDRAVEYFKRSGANLRLFELLLHRGTALAALGRVDEAEADFLAGIESYERLRTETAPGDRITYFDRSRALFDAVVRLGAEHGRSATHGWSLFERSRGRDLLDRFEGQPIDADELRDTLPPRTAVVAYAVLDDRVLAWTISDGVRQSETPLAVARLERLVAELLASVGPRARRADPGPAARELHRLLIEPLELPDGVDALIVVPDGSLHRVPFAALVDPRDGRYLAERYVLSIAPSASVLRHVERRAATLTAAPSLLVVGDPAFSPSAFPGFARLPGAAREASLVAGLYGQASTLTGDEATPASFADAARRHDVIHVAAHAISDPQYPERSRLALAVDPSRDDDGALTADEVQRLPLDDSRLVVLAACSTASGRLSRSEGALSLARALLAAGSPSVVGSLWNIDDAASTRFFESFHRRWLGGATVSVALRDAQREMITSGEPSLAAPSTWAAFQVYGSPSVRVGG